MSIHTLPPEEQDALNAEMEAARISFERWRSIHRPRICNPTLRDEYPDKYAELKRDADRERAEELDEEE